MTIAITISVIAGMAIGFRFKIYMVVPAIVAATLSTAAVSMAHGGHFWWILAAVVASAVAVQVGYVCATFALSMKEAPVSEVAQTAGSPADAYQPRTRFSA